MGEVGVDIFFGEVQVTWDELHPFADRRALATARRLDLGTTADDLARRVSRKDFARLVAALVRVELAGDHDAVLAAAAARTRP